MLNENELKSKLQELRALPAETECVEFKKARDSFSDFELGEYFSALSNEANLKGRAQGWLVLGVEDAYPHPICGTNWYRGNPAGLDELKHKIAEGTRGPSFSEIYELNVPEGRVLMFAIPPASPGIPTAWKGHYFGRNGQSKVALPITKLEEIRGQALQVDWSAEVCPDATIAELDSTALELAKRKFLQKFGGQRLAEGAQDWSYETLLDKARLTRNGKLTRAALLLLGKEESAHYLNPHPAEITWKLDNEEKAYEHFGPPFLLTIERVYNRIRNVRFRIQAANRLLPDEIDKYDPTIVLEALNNCIAHQDYTKNARILVIEKPDRLILTNRGNFFEGVVDDYVLHDHTPQRYRNVFLAQAMFQLDMIDRMGMGIRRIFEQQGKRYLPMPEYDLSITDTVSVTIYGRQLNETYGRILMERKDLSLAEIVALDRVQKMQSITQDMVKLLRAKKVVAGRVPKLYLSADVAKVAGSPDEYTKHRAFDTQYYKDLITTFLGQHKEGTPLDFQRLLADKLSDLYTPEQRKVKIRNLLQDLSKAGIICNVGARGNQARWVLAKSSSSSN